MTDEQTALARRAVACKGWKWMDGMVTTGGVRLVDGEYCATRLPSLLPNLTDPATLGCLLALYEETRKMLTCPDPVYTYASAYGLLHPRTAEALVAALEAAP